MILRVAIVGRGTMGNGIALLVRNRGQNVNTVSVRELESGDTESEHILRRAGLILEYGPEDEARKLALLHRISALNESAIIATGTSSLRISDLAAAVKNPSRFVGIHFINPPLLQKTVELVTRQENTDAVINDAKNWLRSIDREVYEVTDMPGFVVNATLFPFLNQAAYVLEQSEVSVTELDNMLASALGAPMGPLAILDFVGLDIAAAIINNLHRQAPTMNLPLAPEISRRIAANRLGKKTRGGFY